MATANQPTRIRDAASLLIAGAVIAVGVVAFPAPAHARTFTVNNTADRPDANIGDGTCRTSAGNCSLRAAIQEANQTAGADVISVPSGRYTLGKAGNTTQPPSIDPDGDFDLDVTDSVTINGAGNSRTIVDGGGLTSVFEVGTGGTSPIVSLARLAVVNGGESTHPSFGSGGGVLARPGSSTTLTDVVVADNRTTLMGTGIYNGGWMVIRRSIVRDNRNLSTLGGGGVTATGGGIFNASTGNLTIEQSTISGNFSLRGGGITNSHGQMSITNSTISGNIAQNNGGGIRNTGDSSGAVGVLNIAFSTITGNKANQPGARDQFKTGGGLANFGGQVNMGGTIMAGNTDERNRFSQDQNMRSPDCFSTEEFRFTSFRNNVVGALSANCILRDTVWGDSLFDQVSRDLEAPLNPGIGGLGANGGPTPTHPLVGGSLAIDTASSGTSSSFFNCPARDQRDSSRPADGNRDGQPICDSGAYELQ
jgi:CSLREA domain-containing protein